MDNNITLTGRKISIKRITVTILAVICLLTGCNATETSPGSSNTPATDSNAIQTKIEYKKISAKEAHKMMSELTDFILLDVRTDEEFKEKRIYGAILIPDYDIKARVENELVDKDKVILIYCRTGRRSALAAQEMVDMGYTNVYDFGGINDWHYDTVSD